MSAGPTGPVPPHLTTSDADIVRKYVSRGLPHSDWPEREEALAALARMEATHRRENEAALAWRSERDRWKNLVEQKEGAIDRLKEELDQCGHLHRLDFAEHAKTIAERDRLKDQLAAQRDTYEVLLGKVRDQLAEAQQAADATSNMLGVELTAVKDQLAEAEEVIRVGFAAQKSADIQTIEMLKSQLAELIQAKVDLRAAFDAQVSRAALAEAEVERLTKDFNGLMRQLDTEREAAGAEVDRLVEDKFAAEHEVERLKTKLREIHRKEHAEVERLRKRLQNAGVNPDTGRFYFDRGSEAKQRETVLNPRDHEQLCAGRIGPEGPPESAPGPGGQPHRGHPLKKRSE